MEEGYNQDYLNQGFDEQQLLEENQRLRNGNLDMSGALSGMSFQPEEEQNLIHYQLDTDKILERCEHFLRGDQIKVTKDGTVYAEPTKNVLCIVVKDVRSNIKYFIQEIKTEEKKGVVIKKVCVKIENADGKEISIHQLDGNKLMEKIRCLKLISEGYQYVEIIDDDKKPFNEYGVSELMRIISMYVTKETFLSYYEEERIYEIMSDLGNALADFIYCNYENMGMNNKFKESKYIMIVLNVLHTIESCYRRALKGAEQENIRTRSIVTQSQGMGSGAVGMRRSINKAKFNPLKPSTW